MADHDDITTETQDNDELLNESADITNDHEEHVETQNSAETVEDTDDESKHVVPETRERSVVPAGQLAEGEKPYDRRLVVNFYRHPDNEEKVDTNFILLDPHEDVPAEHSYTALNQMIVIAQSAWLGLLVENNPQAIIQDLNQNIHSVYSQMKQVRGDEDAQKFLDGMRGVLDHMDKDH